MSCSAQPRHQQVEAEESHASEERSAREPGAPRGLERSESGESRWSLLSLLSASNSYFFGLEKGFHKWMQSLLTLNSSFLDSSSFSSPNSFWLT